MKLCPKYTEQSFDCQAVISSVSMIQQFASLSRIPCSTISLTQETSKFHGGIELALMQVFLPPLLARRGNHSTVR